MISLIGKYEGVHQAINVIPVGIPDKVNKLLSTLSDTKDSAKRAGIMRKINSIYNRGL